MNFKENFKINNCSVQVRSDEYRHRYYITKEGVDMPADEENGIIIREKNKLQNNVICSQCEVDFLRDMQIDKLFLRSGINCYMDKYPDWNDVFFPTMLKCERTHFKGYLESPNGKILALASPNVINSWSLDYNRAIYGEENHVGHRIYTFCIHFFNFEKEIFQKNKEAVRIFHKGEKFIFTIFYGIVKNLKEASEFWRIYTLAPQITSSKWTYEIGEKINIFSDGELKIFSPCGKNINNGANLEEEGIYFITAKKNGKETTARVFARKPLSSYLSFAADCSFRYPQKPSTHAEAYYGFFSAFLYAERSKDKYFLKKTESSFATFCSVMENAEGNNLVKEATPRRIQNLSTMISLYTAAYKATKKEFYIQKGVAFAKTLMKEQAVGGEYLGWGKVHYTCVIYPAKSMMELADVLTAFPKYASDKSVIFASAAKAVEDLAQRMDNIATEGQQTFEDGMISCEALQLGMAALKLPDKRNEYVCCAETLIKRHECLEQKLVSDCRMQGCTLRFWESMYDVLINKNMMNSPHGWSSWKTYATFYLYILTGEDHYLKETFDTLGACLQCFDMKRNRLNWAFIVDPIIHADIFSCNKKNNWKLEPSVFGQQYLPMISDHWRSSSHSVSFGYAYPDLGKTNGIYQGGCCDNDVHEHIKCMGEVGLNAFVHEEDNEFLTYNCTYCDGKLSLNSKYLRNLYFYSKKEREICFENKKYILSRGFNIYNL